MHTASFLMPCIYGILTHMYLKSIELSGFKSFAKKSTFDFNSPIAGVVGPNGSGKSNAAEAFRFVLGEQSMKAMRTKRGADLIWVGNEHYPKANRARVAVVFDNKDKFLNIDFDEVHIERIAHRDGAHEYFINGSKVRLKDVTELLSKANIGASGHHIISQGEADRILNATPMERRAMIEEALGLKTFHFKKIESEKKLDTVLENIREAKMVRRELAPRLEVLKQKMVQLERRRTLKKKLHDLFVFYITSQSKQIADKKENTLLRKRQLQAELEQYRNAQVESKSGVDNQSKLDDARNRIVEIDIQEKELAKEKSTLEHKKGILMGRRDALSDVEIQKKDTTAVDATVVKEVLAYIKDSIRSASEKKDFSLLSGVIAHIDTFQQKYLSAKGSESDEQTKRTDSDSASIDSDIAKLENEIAIIETQEEALRAARSNAIADLQKSHEYEREKERKQNEESTHITKIQDELQSLSTKEQKIQRDIEKLTTMKHRAEDLGVDYSHGVVAMDNDYGDGEDVVIEIEKTQALLNESEGVDESIVSEYKDIEARYNIINNEVGDLEHSRKTILNILADIDTEIATRFNEGMEKINTEFHSFFTMLFSGGHSKLVVEKQNGEEDEHIKEGIQVEVQLPRKKATSLEVLSGGERALTSIALIFAMSQVNPPPFIILDETDAALDEANSRRYAQMVQALSDKSQLILITHNRRTMEAAGELYGVTMGSDGISKLLSVKFEEALSVAK